jgi:glycosyltransferase involved in cell wall biosynthesis
MIEAMACGTPVLAFRQGSVPEVVDGGITGIVVETIEQAIAAVPRLVEFDRAKVRLRFEQRFTASRMAQDYVNLYKSVVKTSIVPSIELNSSLEQDESISSAPPVS